MTPHESPAGSPGGRLSNAVTGEIHFVYVLSSIVVGLLVAISAGGLLFHERLYDPDPLTLPAFIAQDAVTLVLAVPLLLAAIWLARRGSVRGLLLWSGMLFYVVYWYYFYVMGTRFNVLFPAYIAVVSVSLYALVGLLARLDPLAIRARFDASTPVRSIGGYLTATALLFAVMWGTDVVRHLASERPLGAVARFVYVIDLVVLLPAMAMVGMSLWRRQPWGYVLAGLLLVKATSSGVMLLVGTAVQTRLGIPVMPQEAIAYAVLIVGSFVFSTLYFRAMRSQPQRFPVRPEYPGDRIAGALTSHG